jgi:hypothetical protein
VKIFTALLPFVVLIRTADLYYFSCLFASNGGGKRDRTADLLHAMQALSQLSYTPMFWFNFNLDILVRKKRLLLVPAAKRRDYARL